ncbi:TetR/AcrR family transcriptional regulator [Mycobacterium sp. PS03-16]|uniref:TetR/AcrR family transcriptional regulator n=1 Tax=Mycobacterium sp. PS03-16 TaxID=2559611 RepID=UPI0010748F44|nr:helix-turn-helix domain-containing protein [Mycobacterium sp. PS03-16]TFV61546.1 TetR/AcrR family transcriptional regulator [Mycobacterium sp. PS03-16]
MPQRRAVDDDIVDTAMELLRTRGPRAVTVEAVTAKSGIAKTTIYRRHRDRRDMLTAALSRLADPDPPPPQADAQERLRWLIAHAVAMVEDGIGYGGFAALLTDEDPEYATAFRQILVDRRGRLEAVVHVGKADGDFRADVHPATLIDGMVGAYIAERARTGGVADGWEERLFELYWPAVRVDSAPRLARAPRLR